MEFRVLGPLQVVQKAEPVALGGPGRRATLAVLLLHLNEVVSSEQLIDALWYERPPPTALQTLRVYISQLRKALGSQLVRTLPSGYIVELERDQLDAFRFERLSEEGRARIATGDAASAAALLHQALGLWRGPALADFTYEPFAQAPIARLEELRLSATEARIDAELTLGAHASLVAELATLVRTHPLRERFHGQLMLALYGSDRQAEALDVYRDIRRALSEELGLEPSPYLQEIERAILRQDALPEVRRHADTDVAQQPSVRKTITMLYVDLGGASAHIDDPESLARRLEEPLGAAVKIVGAHEGTVTTTSSDSVIATFGHPSLHEDDALRAVRAAVELHERLRQHAPRSGVATGEVVTLGDSSPVGSVAGTSARLAHLVGPGEIGLDTPTRMLAGNAIDADQLLSTNSFRLRKVLTTEQIPRHFDTPLIGREGELAALRAALERVIADRKPVRVVLSGPPGIGKSRLARELLANLGDDATALKGSCPSYGENMTLWPLRQIVREAAGNDNDEALSELLLREDDGPRIADAISSALGQTEHDAAPGETSWAFRRFFEALAREQPHVIVVEDAHWAEPSLLDLLDRIHQQATDSPLIFLLLSRPDIFESRPAWVASAINLTPLSLPATQRLVENLPKALTLRREFREQVVALSEGNPLVAEQFVALAAEGGQALPLVAPNVHAILAARLDRLGPAERALAERAAVVGREFTLEAVAELLEPGAVASAARHLESLVRKMLVEPDGASSGGKGGFKFQHSLIHDAAYRRLPKGLRAELHERLAHWMERRAGSRIAEVDEVIGYHFELACRYRAELGAPRESLTEIAARAATRLTSAGKRAFQRMDLNAGASLLKRALELMEQDDPVTVELMNTIAAALGPLGELEQQSRLLDETIRRAKRLKVRGGEWQARVERRWADQVREPDRDTPEQVRRHAERALRVFRDIDDYVGAARASALAAHALRNLGRARAAEIRAQEAVELASASGVHWEKIRAQEVLANALLYGPTPIRQAIVRCDDLLSDAPDSVISPVPVSRVLAVLTAMDGQIAEARRLIQDAADVVGGVAHRRPRIFNAMLAGDIEMLAGETTKAATLYSEGIAMAREIGHRLSIASLTLSLTEAYCRDQWIDKAAQELSKVVEPGRHNPILQIRWLAARARVLAMQGDGEEAVRLCREAESLVVSTDLLNLRGDVALALAQVQLMRGAIREAASALDEAVRLFKQKGNSAAATQAQQTPAGMEVVDMRFPFVR